MKIGIVTYHRSNNYGALLQAIALREILARADHFVTFIDYWPDYHYHVYALFSFRGMINKKGLYSKIVYLINRIHYYKHRKVRKTNFDVFIKKNIEPYISSINDNYDVIVHGSDQIWRKQPEIGTYNPVYFGKHQIKTKRKVSYAASMGILPQKESDKAVLKEYISYLDFISVREKDLQVLVKELGYSEVSHDLDPTLLLPMDYWINKFNLEHSKERYAIYYRMQGSFDMEKLRSYADSKRLKLKVIYGKPIYADSEEKITAADPQKFLQLIYGAEIVFTSSFHGLAFALIFHKPFFASFQNNSSRASSLLRQCDLESRMLAPNISIPSDEESIDFSKVDNNLEVLRAISIDSLKNSLSY